MDPLRAISPAPDQPPALHERAMDNLRYIRETMERATAFTGISGWGEVAIGVTALIAAVLAANQTTFKAWLAVWIAEGLISLLIAGWSMDRKARAASMPLAHRTERSVPDCAPGPPGSRSPSHPFTWDVATTTRGSWRAFRCRAGTIAT